MGHPTNRIIAHSTPLSPRPWSCLTLPTWFPLQWTAYEVGTCFRNDHLSYPTLLAGLPISYVHISRALIIYSANYIRSPCAISTSPPCSSYSLPTFPSPEATWVSHCHLHLTIHEWPEHWQNTLDYCVAAFGIVLIISTFQWIVDGRKNFTGPRTDLDVLAGEMSVPVETTSNSKSAQEEFHEK